MGFPIVKPSRALRRLAGAAWLAAWCGVLWAVAAPRRQLGGLESERLRWLEWWSLCAGIALGFTMGRGMRDWVRSGVGRTHARALRVALYPPGLVAAIALVALSAGGERGPVGVVATAFLSYWAGLDVAFGAVPLIEGRSYAFARPLDPDDDDDDDDERRSWDRL
jgi:hypothetical protein